MSDIEKLRREIEELEKQIAAHPFEGLFDHKHSDQLYHKLKKKKKLLAQMEGTPLQPSVPVSSKPAPVTSEGTSPKPGPKPVPTKSPAVKTAAPKKPAGGKSAKVKTTKGAAKAKPKPATKAKPKAKSSGGGSKLAKKPKSGKPAGRKSGAKKK